MGTGVEFLLLEEAAMLGIGELVGASAVGSVATAAGTAIGFEGLAAAELAATGLTAEAAGAGAAVAEAGAAAGASSLGSTVKGALPYINAATGLGSLAMTLGGPEGGGVAKPALTEPTAMPAPFSQNKDVNAARRASIAEQMRRRGRASTILTDQSSDKLG